MPRDAQISGDGFRFYGWEPDQSPEQQLLMRAVGLSDEQCRVRSDVLSVTSIRSLTGEPWQLVRWKINNVVKVAMGTRQVPAIGKRGRPLKGKNTIAKDGPFPGEFVTRMVQTRGEQAGLEEVRSWLLQQADEPRDVAAVRGSVVHKMIEMNTPLSQMQDPLVKLAFDKQWMQERRKVKPAVLPEDITFAQDAMANYWDMREKVPFVILAQEPQVWNLEHGYAGSADVMLWFLGHWSSDAEGNSVFTPLPGVGFDDILRWQALANKGLVWLKDVEEFGGELVLGDWKTSKDVYTSHVVQTIAYMACQFVGGGGKIDQRLTELLLASMQGMVIHIRPDGWAVDLFDMRQDILMAYLGSVQFARFLALYAKPANLFTHSLSGVAPGIEREEEDAA